MVNNLETVEMLERILNVQLRDLHVSLPGKVQSYDKDTQTANIRIMQNKLIAASNPLISEDIVEELPVLPAVPMLRFKTGNFFLHFPVQAGDEVLIIFCDSDIDDFQETGQVGEPSVGEIHGLSGAVALPMMFSKNNALRSSITSDSAITLGYDNTSNPFTIQVTNLQLIVGGDSDAPALASQVKALEFWIKNHTHTETGSETDVPSFAYLLDKNYECGRIKCDS